MTTNGGDVVFVVNSFLLGIGWEREARRATPRRASLFISSESDPNPARTVTYSVQVQAPPDVPARSGEHL